MWGADAPAHGCNDPYMGCRCTLIVDAWRYNGHLCIWGVAALACGCMETPGYAVNAWRPLGTG